MSEHGHRPATVGFSPLLNSRDFPPHRTDPSAFFSSPSPNSMRYGREKLVGHLGIVQENPTASSSPVSSRCLQSILVLVFLPAVAGFLKKCFPF